MSISDEDAVNLDGIMIRRWDVINVNPGWFPVLRLVEGDATIVIVWSD